MMQKEWVVVRTQPRRELFAKHHIQRQAHLVYCPMLKKWDGKIRTLFPSYLFVQISNGQWWFLKGTFGVAHPVMHCGKPAVMPEREIHKLKKLEGPDELIVMPDRFRPGQKVRVASGAFINQLGTCVADHGDTVSVLFNFLNQKVKTKIASGMLEECA
jgi:transcriptional antiterminator RfaH